MRTFYLIAEKDLFPQYPHHADWPKQVAYCYEQRLFMLSEGKGHGLGGSTIPQEQIRKPGWLEVLAGAEGLWFLDFIETGQFADEAQFAAALSQKIGPLRTLKC